MVDAVEKSVEGVGATLELGLFAVEGGDIVAEAAIFGATTEIVDSDIELLYAVFVILGFGIDVGSFLIDLSFEGFRLGTESLESRTIGSVIGDYFGAIIKILCVVVAESSRDFEDFGADQGMKLVMATGFVVAGKAARELVLVDDID